jgi:hypothetical protein
MQCSEKRSAAVATLVWALKKKKKKKTKGEKKITKQIKGEGGGRRRDPRNLDEVLYCAGWAPTIPARFLRRWILYLPNDSGGPIHGPTS